jgi:hypothetical protein
MRVNPTKCQSKTLRAERSKGNWKLPLDVIEYILIKSCMSGSHHPSLTLKTILLLMKGCQEAIHPVPIIVLFDLMFDHSD